MINVHSFSEQPTTNKISLIVSEYDNLVTFQSYGKENGKAK